MTPLEKKTLFWLDTLLNNTQESLNSAVLDIASSKKDPYLSASIAQEHLSEARSWLDALRGDQIREFGG